MDQISSAIGAYTRLNDRFGSCWMRGSEGAAGAHGLCMTF